MIEDATTTVSMPQPKPMGLSIHYRRYALTMLFLVYMLNFVDRQIVNILAEPIKRELGLADWQLGSLTGLSFAIFYATLALPIARWAERANRVRIVALSAITWSLFTTICGVAQTFAQLFLARVGVGVGEAGCTPASQSLISDYTTRERRASALAFFSMGIPAGTLVGMVVGGLIADSLGWRASFALVGVPGIILGLLAYFTLPEPRKSFAASEVQAAPSLREALAELGSKRTYIWLTVAMAAMSFGIYSNLAFQSSHFLRNHAEGLGTLAVRLNDLTGIRLGATGFLGTVLGLIVGICGAAGTWLGGWSTDRGVRSSLNAYATIPAAAALCMPFALFATYTASNTVAALCLMGLPMMLQSIYYGPIFAAVQSLVRPRTRATATAIFLFFANLIGLGLGPLSVGLISDLLAPSMGSGDAIRWALISTSLVYVLAAAAFMAARKSIRQDIVS
ncbi:MULTISPECIES: spinster family MFS transporter [Azospirillum]|uniref:MFS transporter n=2 Tax=Azospirillum lipoferum TaxID=193 RepID=A0A5A9GRC5_AZOLI|nr:MFS transporter [Azospirillum sp. NL1]KAA0595869.1 MFS transporter [Azospirillum lipoferum]MDW5537366.1 MFS transporter [Azospirillum sp. NL1]